MRELVRRLIPSLTHDWRKGQHGRIGVMGGSTEYTGAPYYASITSLKTGADLCHVFCAEEAATAIKSYSPELIVHPFLLTDKAIAHLDHEAQVDEIEGAIHRIASVLHRLDTLVIGPGLSRDPTILGIARGVIELAKKAQKTLVLDGDALYMISKTPSLIKGYKNAILTPNGMEYARICAAVGLLEHEDPHEAAAISPQVVASTLATGVVVRKGGVDVIADENEVVECRQSGCPRRCGGQGDIMSGAIATFASWAMHPGNQNQVKNPLLIAAYGGSLLTRASAKLAFETHGRSMTAPDIINSVGRAFNEEMEK